LFDVPYARVEAALATAYGVRERDLGAFRARLTFWQKGGVLGVAPGKGKAIRYGPDLIHRLIFSIELAECGATPAVVVGTVTDLWERRIRGIFARAAKTVPAPPGPGDVVMLLAGTSLMLGGWISVADALPNVNGFELRRLPDNMALLMAYQDGDPLVPRALVFNLSERLRRFHAALAATPETDQPQAAQTKAKKGARPRKGTA
jgi:hypothetical protein